MTCACPCDITYCDEIEAIRSQWASDPVLQAFVPSASGSLNRVFELGKGISDSLPYVVLSNVGELESGLFPVLGIRIVIYTQNKLQAAEIEQAIRDRFVNHCMGFCVIGGTILWGRLQRQGSGFRNEVFYKQLLLRLRLSKEGN